MNILDFCLNKKREHEQIFNKDIETQDMKAFDTLGINTIKTVLHYYSAKDSCL